MSSGLFDTTVMIDFHRLDAGAVELIGPVLKGDQVAAYSPITVAEIWRGSLGRAEELHYRTLLELLEEVPVTTAVAEIAGNWLRAATLNEARRLIGDAIIAATAFTRGEVVFTRNIRDFGRFPVIVRTC